MAAQPNFRIVSEIYETVHTYPIVIHIFQGGTAKQAAAFYKAHMLSDAFLRGCVEKGRFANFTCREEHRLEKRQGSRWVRIARGPRNVHTY